MQGEERAVAIKIAVAFIGAVVGAGFASGQEINQFFGCYGEAGETAIIFAGLFFSLWGAMLLNLCARRRLASYSEYLSFLFGRTGFILFDCLITLFLFSSGFIMFSAGNALFLEHLGTPAGTGGFLTAAVTLGVLWGGLRTLVSFNVFLVPLKFLICLIIFFLVRQTANFPEDVPINDAKSLFPHWTLAALCYTGFNMLGAMVVLAPLSQWGKERCRFIGAAFGGFGLALFAMIIFQAMLPYQSLLSGREIPMLFVAGMFHPLLKYSYFAVFWLAIVSTAIVSFFGVAVRFSKRLPYHLSLLLFLAAGLFFARYSFSFLISVIYPFFGAIGLFLLAAQIYRLFRNQL